MVLTASNNDEISLSDDGGVTWSSINPPGDSLVPLAFTPDGTNLFAISILSPATGYAYGSGSINRFATPTTSSSSTTSSSNAGWDGWIELSGTNHATGDSTGNSGVTYVPSTGQFVGYGWGSDVVGWLQFNTTGSSTPPGGGPSPTGVCLGVNCDGALLTPSVTLSIGPSSVTTGTPATLTWSTANVTGCSESSSGIQTDSNWNGNLPATSSGSTQTSAFSAAGTETYGLSCTANAQAGGGTVSATPVVLTVTTVTPPNNSGMCSPVPSGGSLCSESSEPATGTVTSSLVSSQSSCTMSNAPQCQFYCPANYHIFGSGSAVQCIINQTIQEQ
jgi:hypothetical protein